MKKSLLAMLLVMVLVIAGCSNDAAGPSTDDSTLQNVLKKKKIVFGVAPGYFPFQMSAGKGEFIGYDIDIMKKMGEELGVDVEFKQFVFDGLISAVQTGEVDVVVAGVTITGSRALAVSLSDPYFKTGQAMMVPAGDTSTKSWEDLDVKGKKIAVGIGTTGSLLAKDIFKNAEVLDFDDFPLAATAVVQGHADAVVYDEPAIAVWNLQNEGQVRQVEGLISVENLGIVVKKNDFETLQWINSFLDSYIDSPQELASRAEWFETGDWLNKVVED
ncbi:transporter substrate-binding domain-containing protein [Sporosarcina sp. FSL K6-1522]|uniref:transporter substrate-binding domain-containing protein n=1 Tax=Sporosarcina sp. FSL K6-1522 TaxID=2921554 RepID=UPI00315B3E43